MLQFLFRKKTGWGMAKIVMQARSKQRSHPSTARSTIIERQAELRNHPQRASMAFLDQAKVFACHFDTMGLHNFQKARFIQENPPKNNTAFLQQVIYVVSLHSASDGRISLIVVA